MNTLQRYIVNFVYVHIARYMLCHKLFTLKESDIYIYIYIYIYNISQHKFNI